MHIVEWIIIGLIAGWATGKIMHSGGYGVIRDTLLGIAGALIGGFIMRALGFAGRGGLIYTTLVAIGGACLLTWLFRMFTARRETAKSRVTEIAQETPEEEREKIRKVA